MVVRSAAFCGITEMQRKALSFYSIKEAWNMSIHFKPVIPTNNSRAAEQQDASSSRLQLVAATSAPAQRVSPFSSTPISSPAASDTSIFSKFPQNEQEILLSVQVEYGLSSEQVAAKLSQVQVSAGINGRVIPSMVGDCPKELIALVNDRLPRLVGGGDRERQLQKFVNSSTSSRTRQTAGEASSHVASATEAADRAKQNLEQADPVAHAYLSKQAEKAEKARIDAEIEARYAIERAQRRERDKLIEKGYTKTEANKKVHKTDDDCCLQ